MSTAHAPILDNIQLLLFISFHQLIQTAINYYYCNTNCNITNYNNRCYTEEHSGDTAVLFVVPFQPNIVLNVTILLQYICLTDGTTTILVTLETSHAAYLGKMYNNIR